MELEKQVCSFDLAQKLDRLRIKHQSQFWWHDCEHPVDSHRDEYLSDSKEYDTDPAFESIYSAFTVSELDELLPATIQANGNVGQLRIEPVNRTGRRHYDVGYWAGTNWVIQPTRSFNMADACAQMLIQLIERKLVTVNC